jgi:hypothetical protein
VGLPLPHEHRMPRVDEFGHELSCTFATCGVDEIEGNGAGGSSLDMVAQVNTLTAIRATRLGEN